MLNFVQSKKEFQLWNQKCLFWCFWIRIFKNCCHIWNQHPWIYQNPKLCAKQKNFKFETKYALCGNFWDVILKSYCHIWNQHPRVIKKYYKVLRFRAKQENFKFGTSILWLGHFSTEIWKDHCHIWNQQSNFEIWKKTIITIETSTLEFFKLKKFVQNKKSQIWSQNVLTGYFMECNFEKLFSYLKSAT